MIQELNQRQKIMQQESIEFKKETKAGMQYIYKMVQHEVQQLKNSITAIEAFLQMPKIQAIPHPANLPTSIAGPIPSMLDPTPLVTITLSTPPDSKKSRTPCNIKCAKQIKSFVNIT